jgi:hypothetical protein
MAADGVNYTPPPTVRDFITHYTPHELFFDWIIGPVGSGKTTGIFFKLAFMASLQAPSPVDGIRRTRAVIVRNTAPQLNDTTISSWNYWFKDGQAGNWRATEKKFLLKFGDVECEVLFRPLDTPDDVARVLSLEVTFVILDEFVQIDKSIVEALSARVGRYPPKKDGGATNWGMWGASNPGDEDSWWYDYLHEKLPENVILFTQPSGFSEDAENLDNLPGQQEYYTNLAKGKTPQWIMQYIEGRWGYSLDGKPVIPTFKHDIHVAKQSLHANPHLPLVIGFDPGVSSAMIVGQMDLNGRLVVLDELVQQDYGAERLCADRLKPLLKARYSGYEVIISPDPAAKSRVQTDEKTVVDVLKSAKNKAFWAVKFPPGSEDNNRLQIRLDAIEHFTTRLTAEGPALLIDPSCKVLIRALTGGWRYSVGKKQERSAAPEKNAYSHPGDAFGYLCRYVTAADARAARGGTSTFRPPVFKNSYAVR